MLTEALTISYGRTWPYNTNDRVAGNISRRGLAVDVQICDGGSASTLARNWQLIILRRIEEHHFLSPLVPGQLNNSGRHILTVVLREMV